MVRRSKRLALMRENDSPPNLPNDIIRMILLRVPYLSHSELKAVCRQWRDVVSMPEFYKDRMTSRTGEHLICLIQYFRSPFTRIQYNIARDSSRIMVLDPVRQTWAVLRPVPDFPGGIPLFCKSVCVNRKLVLIGGRHSENWQVLKRVYIFDFVSAKWSRRTDIPTLRIDFACSVSSSTGLIYVAGGRDNYQNALLAAEAYNVEEDNWEILPPMSQPLDHCHGVFMQEKFFVFSQFGSSAEIFDPNTVVWTRVDNMRNLRESLASSFVISGHLYTLTGGHLIKYDAQQNDWIPDTYLPSKFWESRCNAEWRGHIFLTQRCRSTRRRQFCGLFNPSTEELIEFYVPRNSGDLNLFKSFSAMDLFSILTLFYKDYLIGN